MNCEGSQPIANEQGRDIYNGRCYFCHGYAGDARTVAARYLEPPPRDFTAGPALTAAQIEAAVRHGRAGTAMRPFSSILNDDEIAAVSAYILQTLIPCSGIAVRYHTAENGWPDHAARNGAAFPFVQGEVPVDRPEALLTAKEREGLELFKRTCSICHEGVATADRNWPNSLSDRTAVASTGEIAAEGRNGALRRESGHHGGVGHEEEGEHHDEEYSREYGEPTEHDLSPDIVDLTPLQRTGRDLYLSNCALCHAADGSGRNWIGTFLDPSPPAFTEPAAARRLDNATLRKIILEGRANTSMPAFRSVLEMDQVDAIAAYLRRAFLESAP